MAMSQNYDEHGRRCSAWILKTQIYRRFKQIFDVKDF